MDRRSLLSSALGSAFLLSGCLNRVGGQGGDGEGTTVEIIPSNNTDQRISLDVSVYATDGTTLLDHAYSLPAGHSDESQGVEDRVDYLVVSRDDADQVRHEYSPDVDICSHDGEDINILVEPDSISFAYSC